MKLVLYINLYQPHRKNFSGLERMCVSHSIEFEISYSIDRLKQNDYDILVSINEYVDYNIIPSNIKIIYGPQFFTFPKPPIIGPPVRELEGRAVFNCLSEWNKLCYEEFSSEFIVPLVPLPFGVDTEMFKPLPYQYNKMWDCLLYIKHRTQGVIDSVKECLKNKNINFITFTYGSYNETDYMYALHNSKFMLTVDGHESQGFALEEAMSCNVPLLVVDAQTMYDESQDGITSHMAPYAPKKLLATSVPYWSDECGIKIKDPSELPGALDRMLSTYTTFNPRKYVEEVLSDKVCMQRILDYFKI